jgi:type II secretory pathway component GspD/PulD (secretin)
MAKRWIKLVAGLLLGTVAGSAQAAYWPDPTPASDTPSLPAPATGRPSTAHVTLTAAIDAQRQGNYEAAAELFRTAMARKSDLTPTEQDELTRLFAQNTKALIARRTGAEQLHLAEKALSEGHSAEAADKLKLVADNELYLTAADRQRFEQLQSRNRPASTPAVDKTTLAKQKVQQARTQLGLSNLDEAERLAREADQLGATFAPAEDSPKKIMQEVAAARTEPKVLLAASRAALQRGDLDRAEKLAKQAEEKSSYLTFPMWASDSPSKVLKDIQAARAKAKPTEPKPTASGSSRPDVTTPPKPTDPIKQVAMKTDAPAADARQVEETRALVEKARKAMQAGELKDARSLAEQARAKKVTLPAWDDTPDSVLADIARAEMVAKAKLASPKPGTKDEAVALLKQGRVHYEAGKYDEADVVVTRLKSMTNITWGMFEDNPDKLLADVNKVRDKQKQEESVKVLAEARKLFEKGDYDAAASAAYRAQKLHGPYNILDFGDKPSKLISEIDTARAKQAKGQKPVETVKSSTTPTTTNNEDRARALLADARAALARNDVAKAKQLADEASSLNVKLTKPGDDSVTAVQLEITTRSHVALAKDEKRTSAPNNVADGSMGPSLPKSNSDNATRPSNAVADKSKPSTPPPLPDAATLRARILLAEARQYQREGRLADAWLKAQDAQKIGGTFSLEEDSPNMAVEQIAGLARKRIVSLVITADGVLTDSNVRDPMVRYQKAEQNLAEASALAAAFRQDAQPITDRMTRIKQLKSTAAAAAPTGPQNNVETIVKEPAAPAGRGQELLQKARLELRNGNSAMARRLVEEALSAPYGVQNEAEAMLRTIDAEDARQREMEDRRTFDAGLAAFNRGDYSQALALIDHIVDLRHLDLPRQVKYRELMSTAEMDGNHGKPTVVQVQNTQPGSPSGIVQVQNTQPGSPSTPVRVPNTPIGLPPAPVQVQNTQPGVPAAVKPDDGIAKPPTDIGRRHIEDNAGPAQSLLDSTVAMRDIKFQQLRAKGLEISREAAERFRKGETDAALEMLRNYLSDLEDQQLTPQQVTLLKRPVESRYQQFKLLKTQADLVTGLNANKDRKLQQMNKVQLAEENKQKKLDELWKQYNALFKQTKYEDARAVALRMRDLDPDNAAISGAITVAQRLEAKQDSEAIKKNNEIVFRKGLNDVEMDPPADAIINDIHFPDKDRWEIIKNRSKSMSFNVPRRSKAERDIEQRLNSPANLNFQNVKLSQVIDDLRVYHNLPIFVDEMALRDVGVVLDKPVTFKLEQVALKSSLKLLLKNVGLTYKIADDCLHITSADEAKGGLQLSTHYVADLVIPIGNYGVLPTTDGQHAPNTPMAPVPNSFLNSQPNNVPPTPLMGNYSMLNGTPTGTPAGATGPFASDPKAGGSGDWQKTSPNNTQEQDLIRMIKNVVSPRSWTDMGGPGTIDYHSHTMSLVINQTPDIQEQVADLLAALRRLQDQEVAVEVKFVVIREDFYERIGVNFSASIATGNTKFEPQLTTGQFAPAPFINKFRPNNFLSGATPAGTLTADLDVPVTNSTFLQSIPIFGGYNGLGSGGITMGLAFLNDIQMFLFLEAVAGDVRSHITLAPKLTLFNGQTATLSAASTTNLVTGAQVQVLQNGNVTFVPQIQNVPVNINNLTLQAVITADRRYVRLSLAPSFTNILPGPIPTFPVVVPIFPATNPLGIDTGVITFTQQIQQPIQQFLSVTTTVAVPDGGTVMLGGLKRLSEARSEFGPPILSNIPIINRLFKNVGFGRETESLMILVTPRIIIQEEEEERATGFRQIPATGL